MLDLLGGLISGGASLLGGILGGNSSKKIAAQQMRMQKEFAQNGIQWKVADAQKAGVHPLYALGANTVSYSPVSVGDSSLASGISQAGQDIGRAVAATASEPGRNKILQGQMDQLALQRAGLENQLLASQIAKTNASIGPPMPGPAITRLVDGQGDSPMIDPQSQQPTKVFADSPAFEPGPVPEVSFANTAGYGVAPVMSKDMSDRDVSDDAAASIAWNLRNRVIPSITGGDYSPRDGFIPEGFDYWIFDPVTQSYRPGRKLFKGSRWWPDYLQPNTFERREYGPPRGMGRH